MSEKTLQEQLRTIHTRLFPLKPISADDVRRLALELGDLVPNAQLQEISRHRQTCRVALGERLQTECRENLAAILIALVVLKGEVMDRKVLSRVRELLLELCGPELAIRMEKFKEQERARESEERKLRDAKGRLQKWVDDFRSALLSLSSIATATERPLSALSETDLLLCLKWADRQIDRGRTAHEQWTDFRNADSTKALRLWSARSAELAAISYLVDLGKRVKDISVQQLEQKSVDWETHDIEADGEPFDVKNSRTSSSSPDSYVEHTIPQFKRTYRVGSEVSIMSVLSEYVPWYKLDLHAIVNQIARETVGR